VELVPGWLLGAMPIFREKGRSEEYLRSSGLLRLYEDELGKAAVKDIDLLLKVARHKEVFFPAAWARYADAKPGTLRIVPLDARLSELEQDYRFHPIAKLTHDGSPW
jgi:hypothetical protein